MNTVILLFLYAAISMFPGVPTLSGSRNTVNPVIGDAGYVAAFGCRPGPEADETLRIRTHLTYVESLLRSRPADALPGHLQEKRARMLDHLHAYVTAGRFPRNYDYPGERKPCFIDRDGAICAVGYLVEQSAGRAAAESINRRYQYSDLGAMNDADIAEWISSSGLTREECAMIQPNYGYYPPANDPAISGTDAVSTAMLSGTNLAFNVIQGVQMAQNRPGTVIPLIGLLTGAGQLILGASMLPPEGYPAGPQRTAAMINIGLGTTTLITSIWSLASARPAREKRTTWNMSGFPAGGSTAGLALSMTHRF